MSNKLLLLGGAGVVVAVLAVVYFFLVAGPTDSDPAVTTNEDPFPIGQGHGSELRRVIPAYGGTLEVLDFLEGAESVQLSEDAQDRQYNLTPYPDYVPGEPFPEHSFDVQYNSRNGEFVVTLNKEPLSQARSEAEAFLRQKLGLNTSDLCQLNVRVGVLHSVNENYSAYQNLGLSSCPDPFPLP